jgi:hypothetical protein
MRHPACHLQGVSRCPEPRCDRAREGHARRTCRSSSGRTVTNYQHVIGAEENVRARSPNHRPVDVDHLAETDCRGVERYRTGTEPMGERSRGATVAVGEAGGTPHLSHARVDKAQSFGARARTPATHIDADLLAD